ncbi:MAG TPA: hypothetical protein VK277_14325 [Acidimicrobiales bacterium]|nr:hypothetical protein [Acidimicrobiales bacterium]
MVALKVGMLTQQGGHRVVLQVDSTHVQTPPVEHLFFYVGLGALAAFEIIEWPLALLMMTGHMLIDATNRPGLHQLGEALGEA